MTPDIKIIYYFIGEVDADCAAKQAQEIHSNLKSLSLTSLKDKPECHPDNPALLM